MSETIAVLFIFFVLVLFGLVFYFKYTSIAVQEQEEELFAKRAIDVTTKTIFLPELLCTKGVYESEDFCIDMMKLRSADEVFEQHMADYYFEMFGYANITVAELYPAVGETDWVLYERMKPNFTRRDRTFFVVALKDQTEGVGINPSYGFGYVTVEVFS